MGLSPRGVLLSLLVIDKRSLILYSKSVKLYFVKFNSSWKLRSKQTKESEGRLAGLHSLFCQQFHCFFCLIFRTSSNHMFKKSDIVQSICCIDWCLSHPLGKGMFSYRASQRFLISKAIDFGLRSRVKIPFLLPSIRRIFAAVAKSAKFHKCSPTT